MKQTSSIRLPRLSVDLGGKPVIVETHGGHDRCAGTPATPIAEAMLTLVLIDHALHHRAQGGDVECQMPRVPAFVPESAWTQSGPAVDDPDPDEG